MGNIGCSCLRSFKKSSAQVSPYSTHFEVGVETCDCGQNFIHPEARFCSFCGRKREGNSSPDGKGTSSGQKFSHICPELLSPPGPSSNRLHRLISPLSGTSSTGNSVSTQSSASSTTPPTPKSPSDCSGDSDHHFTDFQGLDECSSKGSQTASEKDVGAFPPGSPMPSSGTPKTVLARRPSTASFDRPPSKTPSFVGHTGCSEEVVAALNQALKHSGSIVTQNLRMRALQVPETLASAYNAAPKPDDLMPQFDAKVDIDNLLEKLPINVSLRAMLSLQRVTFMSTEWLGIRLVHGNHTESLRFCLCATALQNIGKNTSRSVVVECPDGDKCMVFACSPMSASRRSEWRSTFCDHAEEIGVLAHIILNDGGIAVKKVTAQLKTWCQKTQRRAEDDSQIAEKRAQREADMRACGFVSQVPLGAESTKQNDAPKDTKRRRFSLMGLVASLEESFASLAADSKKKSSVGTEKVGAHRRRMSTPGGLDSGAPRVGSSNDSPETRSGSKQRRHSLGTASPSGREEGRRSPGSPSPSRERRGSDPSLTSAPRGRPHSDARSAIDATCQDPGFDATCQEDQAKAMAAKLKRRPSLADIMPTLDEDSMTSIGLKSAPLASFRSSSKRSDCESPKLKRRHSLGCLDNVGDVGERRASK